MKTNLHIGVSAWSDRLSAYLSPGFGVGGSGSFLVEVRSLPIPLPKNVDKMLTNSPVLHGLSGRDAVKPLLNLCYSLGFPDAAFKAFPVWNKGRAVPHNMPALTAVWAKALPKC